MTPAAVPDSPTTLELVSANIIQVTIQWQAPYNGGSDIQEYRVYWDEGDQSSDEFVLAPTYQVTPDLQYYTVD